MLCTNSKFCVLEAYHPETKKAIFFLVHRHDVLLTVMKCVTDSILKNIPIKDWPHIENKYLEQVGKNVIGRIPNFESLKPLRTFLNALSKKTPQIKFI